MQAKPQMTRFEDFWKPLSARQPSGGYFCRVAGYGPALAQFLEQAMQKRAQMPLRITGKLQNPDGNQLDYLHRVLDDAFTCDPAFFAAQLQKWLPRLSDLQRTQLSQAIFDVLEEQRRQGKNDNMLRNAYTKFLCWMYYRFEQLLHLLGKDPMPRILYDGELSSHEFQLFCILARAGCDILLIEPKGDAKYQTLDPKNEYAALCTWAGSQPFPPDFSLEQMVKTYRPPMPQRPAPQPSASTTPPQRPAVQPSASATPPQRPSQPTPQAQHPPAARPAPKPPVQPPQRPKTAAELFPNAPIIAPNTWLSGNLPADSLTDPAARGEHADYIYTMFVRIFGVEDKSSYTRDLFLWRKKLEDAGRHVTVLEELPIPTPEETARVARTNAQTSAQVIAALLPMLQPMANQKLDAAAGRAFVELLHELEQENEPVMRIKNKGVYLVCWFNRYCRKLFEGYSVGKLPVLIYFGVCQNAFEALFLRFLARMPIDLLQIYPEQGAQCFLKDRLLFERVYPDSLDVAHFPDSADAVSYRTAAYHAEQELTETLYQDSGLYRAHQYQKASAVSLQTMCEEIYILWDKEAVYRPGFEVIDDTVLVPVLTAKVSGIKNRDTGAYWSQVKRMMGEDTICITRLPYMQPAEDTRLDPVAFIKNRKLQREALKNSPAYPYGLLRPEVQDFLLDKVQLLLDSGLIRGTFSQGMEYKILSVAMQLPKEIVRILQKADFTQAIPKIAVVATGEASCSLEDSILLALLHHACFDVVLFVPTGYQIIEKYYTEPFFTEHQAGEYLYDLQPPYLSSAASTGGGEGIFSRFFRRGHT